MGAKLRGDWEVRMRAACACTGASSKCMGALPPAAWAIPIGGGAGLEGSSA